MAEAFSRRLERLPWLGVGLSTEYGAAAQGIDPVAFRDAHPGVIDFLEIGADLERGIDAPTRAWVDRGWPTTWHFLDLNLEEPEDLDPDWVHDTAAAARATGASWLCGDAGIWHVGPRDRGHGTLLPPILCRASARTMAGAVRALREATGFEVLPENPPAQVLVGDLHPLEYFGELAERADSGLLLDLAHLAIVQVALDLPPTALLDAFPVERVVELHVAGGTPFRAGSRTLIDDDHGPEVHDHTWALLEAVLARATALRAVVIECERNPPDVVLPLFARVRAAVAGRAPEARPPALPERPAPAIDHRATQRTLFRMLLDPAFATRVRAGEPLPLPGTEAGWLRGLDPDLVAADPGGRRRDQLLGNLALEFLHTVRAAPPFLEGFPASPEFHDAIAGDRPLALAFAAFAARVLPPGPWRDLLALDAAMAEARRPRAPRPASPGLVGLGPFAHLLTLPAGTVDRAAAIRDGRPAPAPRRGRERVSIVASPRRHGPAELAVEVLSDAVGELLAACPVGEEGLARFARRHGATRDEVAGLVADLVADGVLQLGK